MDDFNRSFLFYINPSSNILINDEYYSPNFISIIKLFKEIPASIFAANHFFSSLPEETFLKNLVDFLKNQERWLSNRINKKEDNDSSNLNSKINYEIEVNNFFEEILKFSNESKFSKYEIFSSVLILLFLFFQENIYGPSFFYIKETEKIDFQSRIPKEFNDHFLFFVEEKYNSKIFNEYLSLEGESPYSNLKLSLFFCIAKFLIHSTIFEDFKIINLWKSRLMFLNNKMLKENTFTVQEQGFNYLNSFIEENFNYLSKEEKFLILLEKANYCMKYMKYIENTNLLKQSSDLLELKLTLSGVLAKKSKYQDEYKAQLILKNEKFNNLEDKEYKDINNIDNIDNSKVTETDDNTEGIISEPLIVHRDITLNEVDNQTNLLDKISIDPNEKFTDYKITIYDQIYIAVLLSNYKKSFADEELLREEIKAYTSKCLTVSYNWLVFSKLLIHRSIAENKISKTLERSLLQIKSISDQHNDRFPDPYERSNYIFAVDYPFIWQNKKLHAEMWMAYGSTVSAFELFSEICMWEEAISCLYIAGKEERAKELALEKIKELPKNETPGILCVLGDLTKNEKYFFQALEISNNKFTRAYRGLGYYYFENKKFDLAVEYFEKALQINPLFPKIWFTLGCIQLGKKLFDKASLSFQKCTSFDDDNWEAWSNLGLCYSQNGKLVESLKCFDEAFKRNRNSSKLLENIMIISVNAKNLDKLIFSLDNLFKIDMHSKVKAPAFSKIIEFYMDLFENVYLLVEERDKLRKLKESNNNVDNLDEKIDRKVGELEAMKSKILFNRNKIMNLFEQYTNKDGSNPQIWDLYCLFLENFEIYKNKIDTIKESNIRKIMLETRMKQLRCITKGEWEKPELYESVIKVCKIVEIELQKYENVITNSADSSFISQVKNHLESTFNKIDILKKKIEDSKLQ